VDPTAVTRRIRPSPERAVRQNGDGMDGTTRVDRWLWAVRLSKTRADAATACRGGHVRVNDKPAKPSTPVRAGDTVRTRLYDIPRIVEVGTVIEKRVGAPVAVTCYVDHTPPPPPKETVVRVAARERGAGRPTKRDRRRMEAFAQASLLHTVDHDLEPDPDAEAEPEE
jgi:ribosome-associated heat shock protein Hsp15